MYMRLLTSVYECIHLCMNNVRSTYRQISQLPQSKVLATVRCERCIIIKKTFFYFGATAPSGPGPHNSPGL
jgi:hypothetical protein